MSSGQEGKDPRCVGCKYYHNSDYDYPCKVCAHIDASMVRDWYEVGAINPVYTEEAQSKTVADAIDQHILDGQKEEQEYLDKLIDDHWAYIESLLKAHGNEMDVGIAEFHYKSAMRHGWKHAMEYVEENKDD